MVKKKELAIVKEAKVPIFKGTPAEMIFAAVSNSKGVDLAALEKLMIILERRDANEARKAYHKAMTAFKAEAPVINKNKKVNYATSKGTVSYTHATLDNAIEIITPLLSRHGLSATWTTRQEGSKVIVTCNITHELGHSEGTTLGAEPDDSGSKNAIQAVGSTATYLERYTFLAALGLATKGMDMDGRTPSKPEVQPSVAKQSTSKPQVEDAQLKPENECHGCGEIVSDAVKNYSVKQFKQCLCIKCQKNPPARS